MQQQRFQEIDSDDDEEDAQGVHLDSRYLQQQGGRSSGDDLLFTGLDVRAYMRNPAQRQSRSYENLAYGEAPYDSDEDDSEENPSVALQVAMRDKEQELVQRALARIQRAREKGKSNVNLTPEEVEALERHRAQQQMASAPVSSRTKGSSNSTNNDRSKKRPSRLFSNSSPSKTSNPSKVRSRKSGGVGPSSQSPDDLPYTTGSAPSAGAPGILVPGPGGSTAYAPIGFRNRDSPPRTRTSRSSPSRPASRSASGPKQTSPSQFSYNSYALSQYPASTYAATDARPRSSSSRSSPPRSLPDDPNWAPRSRSTSTASLAQDGSYPGVYASQQPPYPTTRRNVSGPEISYSSVRRKPVTTTTRPAPIAGLASHSDSALAGGVRRGPGGVPLAVEVEVEESSSDEDDSAEGSEDEGQGVQVMPERYSGAVNRGGYAYGYGYSSGARGGTGGFQRRPAR